MKKHLFLICCALSLFASSQVHVQNNGVSVFGCLPSNISKLNSSDSVTACRIFSPNLNRHREFHSEIIWEGKSQL